jgi:hypothetical protein
MNLARRWFDASSPKSAAAMNPTLLCDQTSAFAPARSRCFRVLSTALGDLVGRRRTYETDETVHQLQYAWRWTRQVTCSKQRARLTAAGRLIAAGSGDSVLSAVGTGR